MCLIICRLLLNDANYFTLLKRLPANAGMPFFLDDNEKNNITNSVIIY